jgi:Mg/Co/Ni transporter MgtE
MARHLPDRAVDWQNLHLTSLRGHDIQLRSAGAAAHSLDAHELAELLTSLSLTDATGVMESVGPKRAADAVAVAHPKVQRRLMSALEPSGAANLIDALPSDVAKQFPKPDASTSATRRTPPRLLRLKGWRRHRPPTRARE